MRKNMIRWMALVVAGLLVTSSAAWAADQKEAGKGGARRAQQGTPPAQQRLDRLAEELKLTPDQKTKVQDVLKKQAEKTKALREDTNLTPEQRREKNRALRGDVTKKMKEILTPDQFKTWQQKQAETTKRPAGTQPPKREGGRKAK